MAKRTPTCNKCGGEHYNFQPCRSGAELVVIESPERRGLRPFGDRLESFERKGNTLFLKGGTIRQRGGVIPPPDTTPEAA